MKTLTLARRFAAVVAIALGAAALLLQRSSPVSSVEQPAGPDSARVEAFLAQVRGANPLLCELAIRSLGVGWGWDGMNRQPDTAPEHQELLRWVTGRPDDAAVAPLLAVRLVDSDACVRRMAARLLGRTRGPRAVGALTEALRSSDPETRRLAAIGLGYAEDRATVDPLIRALRDRVAGVRAASAWALGEIEDERPLAELARLLGEDPDPAVRRAAAIALGLILN